MCGKNFSIYGLHIPRKSCPSPPALKNAGRSFRKSVSPKTEGVGGSYDLLYQYSIRKYEDDLEH